MTRRQIRWSMLVGEMILGFILYLILSQCGVGGVLLVILLTIVLLPIEILRQFDVFYTERNTNG